MNLSRRKLRQLLLREFRLINERVEDDLGHPNPKGEEAAEILKLIATAINSLKSGMTADGANKKAVEEALKALEEIPNSHLQFFGPVA